MKSSELRAAKTMAQLYSSSLQAFENEAVLACRALQVTMAINTFGVGKLLPNNLPNHFPTSLERSPANP
ncbi:hypothetical protein SFA35_10240 [Pseudomonas sp. HR96]|uniref:hypothetical protein n=1 Tax=Pseudomonas sp. HR96 TaxID=1027966 RepID=UPI002A75098D|nr:hypothetical protein [Pseudomonas sp. HR96]WPP01694.1 hypothetical protein SFA35_10240 [Pseudomonas sp. HR96]